MLRFSDIGNAIVLERINQSLQKDGSTFAKAKKLYFEWKFLTETTGYGSRLRFDELLDSDRNKIEFARKYMLLDKFKIPKALHSIAF